MVKLFVSSDQQKSMYPKHVNMFSGHDGTLFNSDIICNGKDPSLSAD